MQRIEITKTDAKAVAAAVQALANEQRHGTVTLPGGLTLDFTVCAFDDRPIVITLKTGPGQDDSVISMQDDVLREHLGATAAKLLNSYRRGLAVGSATGKLRAACLRQLRAIGDALADHFGGKVPAGNAGHAVHRDPEQVRLLHKRDRVITNVLAIRRYTVISHTGIGISDDEILSLSHTDTHHLAKLTNELEKESPYGQGDVRLDLDDVAIYLGITTQSARNLRSKNRLAAEDDTTSDGRPYWRPSTIDHWLRTRPGAGTRTDLTTQNGK